MYRSFLIALVSFVITLITSSAHVVQQLYVEKVETDKGWALQSFFDAGYAIPETRNDPDIPQPTRDWLVALSPDEHASLKAEAKRYLTELLTLEAGGKLIPVEVSFPDFDHDPPAFPVHLNDGAYFHVLLTPQLKGIREEVTIHCQAGPHPDFVIRLPAHDAHLAEAADSDATSRYAVLKPGGQITVAGANADPVGRSLAWHAFVQGVIHVVPAGLDHILFILGIFLLQRRWKPLALQSIAFTISHTITLGLAAAGVVKVSGNWVEPLIALSIAAVAIENFFLKEATTRRMLIIFGFGLIHGLGFASALSAYLQPGDGFLTALISINLGVETAQIAILAAAWVLTIRWHDTNAFTHTRTVANGLLALVALWWFFERIL
ncbi:HupE/UreJ family protein [Sulfuriroseicoccus oceanibius]|uniref:HupE/UreJ family protein n=1 Tax=Sulfuriroseicoccus oceanibius TaxID=2707525 RepID=A0A6B3L998_9BACT|nr:HupE/UreJ family protein [Sulfuriroseicoccus oceanibius]QQL45431.1 HupE/UreJ family protein [Sulfuriroseicoccus oceanibius]